MLAYLSDIEPDWSMMKRKQLGLFLLISAEYAMGIFLIESLI
jgi:hypothetical protein